MDNHYGGTIWTNHAMERMKERGISQGDAWATFQHPEQSRPGQAPGSWIYYRTYGQWKIEVVGKQNEKKEWIILSVWSRPVNQAASQDSHQKPLSLWQTILRQIFGR